MRDSFYSRTGKRLLDVAGAGCAIVLLSPLMLLVALAVKASGRGPVIFSHKRIGCGFSSFYAYKFRTMVHGADRAGSSITTGGDARITSIGRLLRKTKLDELPQLFNVLAGDMSLVGPRPEVDCYVQLFRGDYMEILRARPGITDYAAIEFRDEETVLAAYEDHEKAYRETVLPAKIALYRKYMAELSFFTDLKILVMTVGRVLGVS